MTRRLRVFLYKFPPPRQTIRVDRVSCFEPLELEYLCASLSQHDVYARDGMADRRSPWPALRKLAPQVVLLTGYLIHVGQILRFARDIKQRLGAQVTVLAGGPVAEVTPELFHCPSIDAISRSADPDIARRAVDALAEERPLSTVPCLDVRTAGGYVRTPDALFDPATLGPPLRTLFKTHARRYFNMFYTPCASVKTAFGCPGGCTFCYCRKMNGGRYATRPMEQVLDEINQVPCDNVYILDDNFLVSEERVRAFTKGIGDLGIRKHFIIYGTVAFVVRHPDLMSGLRHAGVEWVILGLEYLGDRDLARVKKGSTARDNEEALRICRALDIRVTALFMVDPTWSAGDFRHLERFVTAHRLFYAAYSTATAFPGTDLAAAEEIPTRERAAFWRYDLLRVHAQPTHMSRMSFYLRLFRLYLLPALHPASTRELLHYGGLRHGLRLASLGILTGMEFIMKLLVFR